MIRSTYKPRAKENRELRRTEIVLTIGMVHFALFRLRLWRPRKRFVSSAKRQVDENPHVKKKTISTVPRRNLIGFKLKS